VIAIDHEEPLLVGRIAHGEHKKMIPGRDRRFANEQVVLEDVVGRSDPDEMTARVGGERVESV
jgi:hypothetical protein